VFDDIDPRSPVPLYEQIANRLRVAVAASEYRAGEPLPSVRQLASKLRVNPATVVQAYRDLEREGFVEMRHGAGTFVKEIATAVRDDEREKQARDLVRRMLAEAARMGLSADDLMRAMSAERGGQSNG
jgi:GntR family transcriptional regulator